MDFWGKRSNCEKNGDERNVANETKNRNETKLSVGKSRGEDKKATHSPTYILTDVYESKFIISMTRHKIPTHSSTIRFRQTFHTASTGEIYFNQALRR